MKAPTLKSWPCILVGISLLLLSAGTPDVPQYQSQPPEALRPVIDGNTDFAAALYPALAKARENVILSPYSLTMALAAVHAGARGQTETQIAQAAHFPTNQGELLPALKRVRDELKRIGRRRSVELDSATCLWAQKNYGFTKDFINLMRERYDVRTKFVDFSSSAGSASREIDAWIKAQTHGKLGGAMPATASSSSTRLVIVNAIYFKGDWASRFERSATRNEPFRTAAASIQAPMMRQTNDFLYAEAEGTKLVVLPYVGGDLSMVVLLPLQPDGFDQLEKNLDSRHLGVWASNLTPCRVDLALPRFKIASHFLLPDTLVAFGMTNAFSGEFADFSGMSPRRPLFINAFDQASIVEVNEEGTVAASATRVSLACAGPKRLPPREFHADHPFVFLIRENSTGVILFLGRVLNPAR